MDRLPPTKGALKEHVKRGWYAAKVLGQSHVLIQNLPAINTAGWIMNDDGTSLDLITPKSVVKRQG